MGAIGRVQGEGGARVSLINFRSRYRCALPLGPNWDTLEILQGYHSALRGFQDTCSA